MSSFVRKTDVEGRSCCPPIVLYGAGQGRARVNRSLYILFAVQGTRIGSAGQLITSSGQADIDGLTNGGFPLGSLVVVLEDNWTQHHLTLCRYFLGQGAVSQHVR